MGTSCPNSALNEEQHPYLLLQFRLNLIRIFMHSKKCGQPQCPTYGQPDCLCDVHYGEWLYDCRVPESYITFQLY